MGKSRKFIFGGSLLTRIDKAIPWDPKKFETWRTLNIGGISKDKLLKRFEDDSFGIRHGARQIISSPEFTTLSEPIEIHLAKVRVMDMGFTESPMMAELIIRIKEIGGDYCPAEVGPHLRLVDKDQPNYTGYNIIMESIVIPIGPNTFREFRSEDGKRWLDSSYVDSDVSWLLDTEVVFLLCTPHRS